MQQKLTKDEVMHLLKSPIVVIVTKSSYPINTYEDTIKFGTTMSDMDRQRLIEIIKLREDVEFFNIEYNTKINTVYIG